MPHSRDRVAFVLFFREKQRSLHSMGSHARQVCDPASPEYGRYLTPAAIARLVSPPAEVITRCRRWLERRGMALRETGHPQVYVVDTTFGQVKKVFGDDCARLLGDAAASAQHPWPLPDDIATHVKSISATVTHSGGIARRSKGLAPTPGPGVKADTSAIAASAGGMTPQDIAAIYDFPSEWTGKGETIGLLNLGGAVDEDDLSAFWTRHGINRPMPSVVNLPRSIPAGSLLDRLEPTMGAAWIGAMAPDAQIVLYNVDPAIVADPWVMFLASAIGRHTIGPHPTILVSTWSMPERLYFARHGRSAFADLLAQATAGGTTYIAASGDWGAYDGRPATRINDVAVADAPWPHGVFPSVEEYVLSVGGTMITNRAPLTELAWSGPLPPSSALRAAIPFFKLASSGGFSEDISLPWWQHPMVSAPRPHGGHYSRGPNNPAVLPTGRGYPDVALMAQGDAIIYDSGGELASMGYEAIVDGHRINWAGGTSLAAPIWAAIVARMNEARRAARLPRCGFVNPLLYRLAADDAASPFRQITVGDSDVHLRVANGSGDVVPFLLSGYCAGRQWNPVTGLGVPKVRALIDAAVTRRRARAGR